MGNVEYAPIASNDPFFSFSQALLARWNVLKKKTFSWFTRPEITALLNQGCATFLVGGPNDQFQTFSLPHRRTHKHESFVYHSNTKLDTFRIFSQIGLPRQVDIWPRYGSIRIQ